MITRQLKERIAALENELSEAKTSGAAGRIAELGTALHMAEDRIIELEEIIGQLREQGTVDAHRISELEAQLEELETARGADVGVGGSELTSEDPVETTTRVEDTPEGEE